MGGYYNGAGTVELFDGESGWQPVSENKMLEKFYGFTAIGINDTVFTFGGALRREGLIGKVAQISDITLMFISSELCL